MNISNQELTLEKWRWVPLEIFPTLLCDYQMDQARFDGDVPPAVENVISPKINIIQLEAAITTVFSFPDKKGVYTPRLQLVKYPDGKPVCFRRRNVD